MQTTTHNQSAGAVPALRSGDLFGDVPLARAMLAWNPLPYGDGRMVVIPHPDKDHWTDRLKLSDTTGACWDYWGEGTKQKRLTQLFIEAWHIACRDRVRLETIHAALMVIPEYRETLSGETFFWSSPNSVIRLHWVQLLQVSENGAW